MKKILGIFLSFLLLFSLCACGAKETETYTVVKDGTTYTVDVSRGEISDGKYVYAYEKVGDAYRFLYPNGVVFTCDENSVTLTNNAEGTIDITGYASGNVMKTVVEEVAPKTFSLKAILQFLVLLGAGTFCVATPKSAWYMKHSRRSKEAEPSEGELWVFRICGAAVIVLGIILFLF